MVNEAPAADLDHYLLEAVCAESNARVQMQCGRKSVKITKGGPGPHNSIYSAITKGRIFQQKTLQQSGI